MERYFKTFLTSELTLTEFCKIHNLDKNLFIQHLRSNNYIWKPSRTGVQVYNYYLATIAYQNSFISHGAIARKFNLNPQSFKAHLIEVDLFDSTRLRQKEKSYNDTIFDSIDTEEKAYWLGFIFADGYIYSAPLKKTEGRIDYNFELCTSSKDKEHIEKFAKFIGYKKSIKTTRADKNGHTRCRICLSSKHLWETLNNYGCTPNKSLTLQFPDEAAFKKKSLIRHFIRGYVDGDGCITNVSENKSGTLHVLGTEQFLNKILFYLDITANLHHNHNNPKEITMYFTINKYVKKCLNYLYKNSTIYLSRKYELYNKICRSELKDSELLQTNIGEGCDVNTEISIESKESIPS